MAAIDVVVVGAFDILDKVGGGGSSCRDAIRLRYGESPVTISFLKRLVESNGNLTIAEHQYNQFDKRGLMSATLNTIYLFDLLRRNMYRTEAVSYMAFEERKFRDLMSSKPKAVIISTTFMTEPSETCYIARTAKELCPETIVIAGGVKILKSFKKYNLFRQGYFEAFDTMRLKDSNFFFSKKTDSPVDIFVIEKSGEATLLLLLERIMEGKDYRSVPNVAFWENDDLVFTSRVPETDSYVTRSISWNTIPSQLIGSTIPVRASVGCGRQCGFCDFGGLHGRADEKDASVLLNELKLIQETYPNKEIFFTDDNMFSDSLRTRSVCEAFIKNGLRLRWRGLFRADAVSLDNAKIIADSGCTCAYIGVESGDDDLLRDMGKGICARQVLDTITLLNENGISTVSTVIIGFPGETNQTVDKTIDLLNSYPSPSNDVINRYYPSVFLLLPLSPAASPSAMKKYELRGGYGDWMHRTMTSDQAKQQLLRCFNNVRGPTIAYFECPDPSLSVRTQREMATARDDLVRSGIISIDSSNVAKVCGIMNRHLMQH